MAFNSEIYNTANSYRTMPHIDYGTGPGQLDCSHFVTKVLKDATGGHFEYTQANGFEQSGHLQRVDLPMAGDIVMWRKTPHGHVGIVLDPAQHLFIGAQSHGVGTDHYNSGYWKSHGSGPIFLRYVG